MYRDKACACMVDQPVPSKRRPIHRDTAKDADSVRGISVYGFFISAVATAANAVSPATSRGEVILFSFIMGLVLLLSIISFIWSVRVISQWRIENP